MKSTKIVFGIALLVSWSLLTALFIVGFGGLTHNNANAAINADSKILPAIAEGTNDTALSASEVSTHNLASSCWFIIDGKVYDVTKYLPMHPGGPGTITPYCGGDATNAFATKDTGRPHSQSATDMLASYYIGDLGNDVTLPNTSQNSAKNMSNATAPTNTVAPVITSTPTIPATKPSISLNSLEVRNHNSASDCWMMIGSGVYDITSYLPNHPGGINTILPYCGKDGASAFAAIGHSSYAQQLLASYYVGELTAVLVTQPNITIPVSTPNITVPIVNPAPNTSNPTPTKYALAQISTHNSASNCWATMNEKVYDITAYLPHHPGGIGAITPYCGGDITAAFVGLPHSQNAANLLASYYIGTVGTALVFSPTRDTAAPTVKIISPISTTYTTAILSLSYTTVDSGSGVNRSACGYTLDTGAIMPLLNCANILRPTPANGAHKITIYSSDNAGNQNSASVSFNVAVPAPPVQNSTNTTNTTQPPASQPTYTLAQISTHNSASNCWATMNGKVYDITAYLPYHPGGVRAITPYCGGDLTAAFTGLPHSQNAANLLASYYIGIVGIAVTPSPLPPPNTTQPPVNNTPPVSQPNITQPAPAPVPTPTPAPPRKWHYDDDDD